MKKNCMHIPGATSLAITMLVGAGALPSFLKIGNAAEAIPADIVRYEDEVTLCNHFAGEPAYDARRKKELVAQVRKHCLPLSNEYGRLTKKYKNTQWDAYLSSRGPDIERSD